MTKIALIADDHDLFRVGLASLLKSQMGFEDVIEVATLDDAVEKLNRNPDITLATFDISMSGVMDVASLRCVREEFPQLTLVVVSGSDKREDILTALSIGLNGYVPKTLKIDDVAEALRQICAGQVYVPPMLVQNRQPHAETMKAPVEPSYDAEGGLKLTPRQRQVLDCIAMGKSNKEIARMLNLSDGTVKVHVNALFRTLGVHNRVSAAAVLNSFTHY